MQSLNMQAESMPQSGSDPVVELLQKYKIPVTLENYLDLAHPDRTLDDLGAEEIAEIPESIRPNSND